MTSQTRFKKLLEPYHIGAVKTKNRMIKSAAGMGLSDDKNGYVSERHKYLYEALARGGVGLIVVEGAMIEPYKPGSPDDFLRICDDKNIPGLSELAGIIHKYDCPAFLSLVSADSLRAGVEDGTKYIGGNPPPFVKTWLQEPPSPDITIAEIEQLVDKYATAAERARKAGLDGVEIHGASQGLLPTFLSRAWNKRQDAYGCDSMENRTRILVEIIQAIKKRAGQDFPISVLINAAEYGIEKGVTSEEGREIARVMEAGGADAIEVRAWGYGEFRAERMHIPERLFYPEPPRPLPQELDASRHGAGLLAPLAAGIKEAVSIPVTAVGRYNAKLGEQVLREGKADFIALTRRLLADPEFPNKVASGRMEDIAPCTACMQCFDVHSGLPLRCRINAFLGGYQEYTYKPAQKKKKVVVVGGGPAGMEAAMVAAQKGHEVMLFEKGHKLGGLLPLAAMVKGTEIEDLPALVQYLKTQITKLGVTIRLGKEVTLPVIEQIKPDVVILATGGIPTLPDIPGIHNRKVVSSNDLHGKLKFFLRFFGPKLLRFLTKFWMPLGKRVVVIGGDIQGSELAEFLVKRGRKVTIVDTAETLGEGITDFSKVHLFTWLAKKGATMLAEVKYEEITDKGLTIITKEGKRQTLAADTIVPAIPLKPNTEFLETLEGKVPEIYAVGDCGSSHLIVDAIADGFRVANTI